MFAGDLEKLQTKILALREAAAAGSPVPSPVPGRGRGVGTWAALVCAFSTVKGPRRDQSYRVLSGSFSCKSAVFV